MLIRGEPMKPDKPELFAIADEEAGMVVGEAAVLNIGTGFRIDIKL